MLLVETYIDLSSVHGLGLFAAEDIPAGTQIWRFDESYDLELDDNDLNELVECQRKFIEHYRFVWNGLSFYCIDNARFINHSSTPNIYDIEEASFAKVDITAGEEITDDYSGWGHTPEDLAINIPWLHES